uniref:Uncharacterized protein n=1 Tax=Rhipicephalus appendiculatus TaxID=34631 RepID=A0A131YCP2_RHIAP
MAKKDKYRRPSPANNQEARNIAFISHMCKKTHGLKNVRKRRGVRVGFAATNKLSRIRSVVHKRSQESAVGKEKCGQRHFNCFLNC